MVYATQLNLQFKVVYFNYEAPGFSLFRLFETLKVPSLVNLKSYRDGVLFHSLEIKILRALTLLYNINYEEESP